MVWILRQYPYKYSCTFNEWIIDVFDVVHFKSFYNAFKFLLNF